MKDTKLKTFRSIKTLDLVKGLRGLSESKKLYDNTNKGGVLGVFIHQTYYMVKTEKPREEVNRQIRLLEDGLHPSKQLSDAYKTYGINPLRFYMLSLCQPEKIQESFETLLRYAAKNQRHFCSNLEGIFPRKNTTAISYCTFKHETEGEMTCSIPHMAKISGVSKKSLYRMKARLLKGETLIPNSAGWVMTKIA